MSTPALSGVAEAAVIALRPGLPLLTATETNQLLLRHRLNRSLARAVVLEAVATAIHLSDDEELTLIANCMDAEGLHNRQELEAWLAERLWSLEDLHAVATHAERLRRWSQWRFRDEVEIRFLDRKLDLDRVVYSLLQVQEQELAEELHQRLRGGEMSFGEAVQQFSVGAERVTQGLVGPIALSAAPAEIGSRLRVGREGQLWSPFVLDTHWCVLRLEHKLQARLDPATREQLLHDLFECWVSSQVELLLQGEPVATVPRPDEVPEP